MRVPADTITPCHVARRNVKTKVPNTWRVLIINLGNLERGESWLLHGVRSQSREVAASGPDITEHRLGGARGYLGWGSQHCGPGTAPSPPVSGSSLLAWTWFRRPWTVPPGVCVWGVWAGGAQMAAVIAGRELRGHRPGGCSQGWLPAYSCPVWPPVICHWPAGIIEHLLRAWPPEDEPCL